MGDGGTVDHVHISDGQKPGDSTVPGPLKSWVVRSCSQVRHGRHRGLPGSPKTVVAAGAGAVPATTVVVWTESCKGVVAEALRFATIRVRRSPTPSSLSCLSRHQSRASRWCGSLGTGPAALQVEAACAALERSPRRRGRGPRRAWGRSMMRDTAHLKRSRLPRRRKRSPHSTTEDTVQTWRAPRPRQLLRRVRRRTRALLLRGARLSEMVLWEVDRCGALTQSVRCR